MKELGPKVWSGFRFGIQSFCFRLYGFGCSGLRFQV